MKRISRAAVFMGMAEWAAQRGTCIRGCVGAIITLDNRPISMGYNGPPAGEDHCYGAECPRNEDGGCHRAVHAEINAMEFARDMGHDLICCVMYSTSSPCPHCAMALEVAGLQKFFYRHPYRLSEGLNLLCSSPMEVYQVLPSGMIIDEVGHEIDVD